MGDGGNIKPGTKHRGDVEEELRTGGPWCGSGREVLGLPLVVYVLN